MSVAKTAYRPFARVGWGGKAASHFRSVSSQFAGVQAQFVPRGNDQTIAYRNVAPTINTNLTGKSLTSTGAILGTSIVELLQSGGDILTQTTTSDASGNYSFSNPGSGPFFVRMYKDGSPNLAGVSDRNLIAI